MKLHVRMLEKLIELPECAVESAAKSPLRHLLDDLGLEVKSVEVQEDRGPTFTIETLANRGDHLYALGVAREISARSLAQIKMPAVANQLPDRRTSVPVRRATEKCSRYALLEMSLPAVMELRNDVALFVEEPGKRHAIVDLLNYVQQEMGQPMHAFDFEKIEGEIAIEITSKPEQIEALDGKTYKIPESSIVIRDRKKIVAVAGIIGCLNSMVTDSTRKILVEAAIFDPVSVRKTARAMGCATDASHFFDRGCDPEGIMLALKRLVHLSGGSAGAVGASDSAHPLGITYTELAPAEKRKVSISLSLIRKHLNLPRLDEVEIVARLKNLGYSVDSATVGKDKVYSLTVPSWRLWDVTSSDDIIEDIARSVSFSRVKPELPELSYGIPEQNHCDSVLSRIRPAVVGNGFIEVITKGFYSNAEVAVLEGLQKGFAAKHVTLKNALEQNNSHLKATNVVHLTRVLSANRKRGVISAKVFESCRIFALPEQPPSDEPRQREQLDYNYECDTVSFAVAGRWAESEFRKGETLEELSRLFTGSIFSVVRALGGDFSISKSENPFLHPGMQGSVKIGRSVVGFLGVVHPEIRDLCELKEPVLYCELDVRALHKLMTRPEPAVVSDFPSVKRDLTLKVSATDQAGKIVRYIHEGGFDSLQDVAVVDEFKRAEEDFRRVTYRVRFQRSDRTLQHEEVDVAMSGVLERLKEKHGVELAG